MKNFGGCSSIFQQLWNYFCARLRVLYWRVKRGFPNFPQTIRFCQLGLFGDWLILPAIGAEWRVNHGNKKWLATHLKMSQDGTLQQKGLYYPVYMDMVAACQQLADLSPKVFQSATNQGILAVIRWLTRQASPAGLLQQMSVSVPTWQGHQVGPYWDSKGWFATRWWHGVFCFLQMLPQPLGRATLAASLAQITYACGWKREMRICQNFEKANQLRRCGEDVWYKCSEFCRLIRTLRTFLWSTGGSQRWIAACSWSSKPWFFS